MVLDSWPIHVGDVGNLTTKIANIDFIGVPENLVAISRWKLMASNGKEILYI